jgi:arylamine N-acetyltransferase
MIDLAAYLDRIGLDGTPTLWAVHRAHVTSITFENLDPWSGRPVSLDLVDVERKLVADRQGGYCFEHNLLLWAGLEQLGFAVDLLLARARTGGWAGPIRPRTHLVLRVWADGQAWLADVGFGFGGCLDPLPCRAGGPYSQSGWEFRVVWDDPECVVQAAHGEGRVDHYGRDAHPGADDRHRDRQLDDLDASTITVRARTNHQRDCHQWPPDPGQKRRGAWVRSRRATAKSSHDNAAATPPATRHLFQNDSVLTSPGSPQLTRRHQAPSDVALFNEDPSMRSCVRRSARTSASDLPAFEAGAGSTDPVRRHWGSEHSARQTADFTRSLPAGAASTQPRFRAAEYSRQRCWHAFVVTTG